MLPGFHTVALCRFVVYQNWEFAFREVATWTEEPGLQSVCH